MIINHRNTVQGNQYDQQKSITRRKSAVRMDWLLYRGFWDAWLGPSSLESRQSERRGGASQTEVDTELDCQSAGQISGSLVIQIGSSLWCYALSFARERVNLIDLTSWTALGRLPYSQIASSRQLDGGQLDRSLARQAEGVLSLSLKRVSQIDLARSTAGQPQTDAKRASQMTSAR